MSVAIASAGVASAGLVLGAIEIEGIAGTLLLLAPIAILFAVIVHVSRRPARKPPPSGSQGPPAAASSVKSAPTTILQAISPGGIDLAGSAPSSTPTETSTPPMVWSEKIRAAEAAHDDAALAGHYLELGREELAAGRSREAADNLRASIRAAAVSKTAAVQAQARLELAELARAAGDLTTACEHWQIARGLFYELKQKPELLATEGHMQKHGCPTDWVLNDF